MASKSFFYADDEPDLYDRAVSLTDRSYEMGHDALQYCLAEWVKGPGGLRGCQASVLNLGCGTGKEALRVLETIPKCRVVAVDNSERMLVSLRQKAQADFGEEVLRGRLVTRLADYSEAGWFGDDTENSGAPFDVVIAAHSLHHLSSKAKERLYGEVRSLLRPGGLFAVLDLFSYDQRWLARLAKENIAQWLECQMAADSLAADHAGLYPLAKRKQLSEMWLDHLRRANIPLPMHGRLPECAQGLSHSEVVLLSASGFQSIEIPFRWLQSGLIISTRFQ